MARILVTGAGGFIGRSLCRALLATGHELVALSGRDGDIADPATLVDADPAEHVFHLAGRTFVPDSWNDPAGFQRVNVLGTTHVLEYCRRHRARLSFVSAYLYGVPDRLPVAESLVPRPNNPYALSKLLAEQVCEFYAIHHGIDVTVLRPFNIFGPGQKSHFLIPQILGDVRARRSIRLKDLAPRRDYLYIDDLVDALMKTLNAPQGYGVFNLGSGRSYSVAELVAMIQEAAGTALPVDSEEQARPNEINDVYADVARAAAVLGWAPGTSFPQGIARILVEESSS